MHFLLQPKHRSLLLLNVTQFLGALNDNVYKLLVVYFLITIQGEAAANTILSLAGGIFVIPFLLFSSAGGVLADRISKRTIIVITKVLELSIMILAILAIYYHSAFGVYFLLFMMGAQSAIFGPSKYGIIPELVEEKEVSRANGAITSFTYLAVIFGTFLASFVTDITKKNFILVTLFCLAIAIIGLIASLGISKTAGLRSTKKINPFFFYEIYQTLSLSLKRYYLFPAILGSAFFLFIGAYVQLNIIPYAMQSLHLSEVGGGYLFLVTAIGIALGAWLAGKLSKDKVELGLSCCAGFVIFAVFILLSIFSHSLVLAIILLILLGIFGGMFLIPLTSFIQVASPDKRRGQIIAACNFLSFAGVLLASLCLYLFNEKFGFTAAGSFFIIGILTLFFNLTVTGRLADFFLPYFSKHCLSKRYKITCTTDIPPPGNIIVVTSNSWAEVLHVFSLIEPIKILLLGKMGHRFPYFNWLVNNIRLIQPFKEPQAALENLLLEARDEKNKDRYVLLFLNSQYQKEQIVNAYHKIFGNESDPIFVRSTSTKLPYSFKTFTRRIKVSIAFTK